MPTLPKIIQGGMGVAVSNWKLAKAVSVAGQMGVVSGTGIDTVLIRRLQDGDLEGNIRRAIKAFPDQKFAEKILAQFFIEGGKEKSRPYKRLPLHSISMTNDQLKTLCLGSFVEVFLAKENHSGVVGINILEKVQMPNLATLFGAILAGVDYVLMGAGIPTEIPGALDLFSTKKAASIKVDSSGKKETLRSVFDPSIVFSEVYEELKVHRPKFLAIISSHTLAIHLNKRATGVVDGFIIEGFSAGGHNAPPRGGMNLNELGEPIYGEKDVVDLEAILALNKPFWLAGTFSSKEKLNHALSLGAAGIQVGTLFAFCAESGFKESVKERVVNGLLSNPDSLRVFTDPLASPTGFPFKVLQLEETLSNNEHYQKRKRVCDLGYLREAVVKEDGGIIYRCPAEPIEDYVKKGGDISQTINRKCLCNCLMSAVGLPQIQKDDYEELDLITAGDDLKTILTYSKLNYSVSEVINSLL